MNYNLVVMAGFGEWLLRHRKALEMKQSDVASRANVSVSYISTIERDQPHSITGAKLTPEREKVIAIAKAVNGDINEALELCGYSSDKPLADVPKPIIEALAREGTLHPDDEILIADFITRLKREK